MHLWATCFKFRASLALPLWGQRFQHIWAGPVHSESPQVQEPWACPDTWMMLRENGDMATLTEKITIDQFGFKILSQATSLPMNYFRLTTGLNSAKHQSFPCNLMKELMIAERVDMQKQGVCEMDCLGQGDLIVLQSARERWTWMLLLLCTCTCFCVMWDWTAHTSWKLWFSNCNFTGNNNDQPSHWRCPILGQPICRMLHKEQPQQHPWTNAPDCCAGHHFTRTQSTLWRHCRNNTKHAPSMGESVA